MPYPIATFRFRTGPRPALGVLAAALLACAPSAPPESGSSAPGSTVPDTSWVLTRLYFGLQSPKGPVDTADFSAFVDTCVTPRFPDGLTRFRADGQWKDRAGALVKEPSMVVEIVRKPGAEGAEKVRAIVDSYKRRFDQEAVMVVETRPEVAFR